MTKGMRLRRQLRARRTAERRDRAARGEGRRNTKAASSAAPRRFRQTTVCGIVFALLVLLKIATPSHLAALRGTLAQWLVRDADFAAAFSAVGHALGEPERFVESLGDAYVAVFGAEQAREVSGGAAGLHDPTPTELPALPDYILEGEITLPFSFTSPLTGTLTSSFGWREDPHTGAQSFHTGLDLAADEGTPFAAFADGTVGVVGESTVLGRYLTVQHTDGFETLYAHCRKISVASGQSVSRGDTLGEVGATGNATGAHLHFALLCGTKYVDPLAYVQQET